MRESKWIFISTCLLLMLGVVMIYSSSAIYAYSVYNDSMYFVKRHILFLVSGLIAAIFCMSLSHERIREIARPAMLAGIALLTLVLVPGVGAVAGGARRWIRFFGLGFQPSEIVKILLIVYLADFVARKDSVIRNFQYGFVPPVFVTGIAGALVLLEPDMGTFVAVMFIGMVMLFVSGVRIKHVLAIVMGSLPALFWAIKSEPYRLKRILTVLDPWRDSHGAGFQLIQSFIALGSGGFFGVGLGESRQKLFYLPESHTDFIFSIIGEELGFIGAASTIILFAVFVWHAFRLSFKIKEKFASLLTFGLTLMISFEVIVNVGVSTGILPTKGLPLPFISYGGSSLVCHLAAVGLILNMARYAE